MASNPEVEAEGAGALLNGKSVANGTEQSTYATPQSASRAPSVTSFKSTSSHIQADATPATTASPFGPLKTPLGHALPSCKPLAAAQLTADQATKYADVLATVSAWKTIPTTSAKNAPSGPITDLERMWLTRECILRYLRATKWNTAQCLQRLQSTLTWRREYDVESFTLQHISPENETGKQIILGFDNDARPCLYLNPGKQNTKKSERQIQHLVFMLDRVIDMMGPGQETTALLINFKSTSSGSNPSVGQGRQVLGILQGHYPERLGRALISELPWYVTTFFKFISPFIDPVTKEKMKFNEPLEKHVPASQLWDQYGGALNFEYDHATYWPALCEMCAQRRVAYQERWEKAGKRIGEHEAYLRGGKQPSVEGITGPGTE
ncbi:Phosphatidylinositol transfer protein (PITP) [Elasticomyces elasticus]|nr:Phosphatidylinositol transfer protein (PITP) [Elasticomyces elasticus]